MKKTAYFLFIAALIFSPMAFGTVETWSYLVMELLVGISAVLFFFSTKRKTLLQVPGLLPLALVNCFLLFQILPLPVNFVKIISPATVSLYQSLFEFNGETGWITLSVHPRSTLMEFVRFFTYIAFYISAIHFFSDRNRLKHTIVIVTGFAALLSLLTIIEFTTESLKYPFPHNNIFWLKELRHGGMPVGPYVNRNHYAGLMEMIFPLVLAMFLAFRPHIARLSLKRRIVDFFAQKRVSVHFFYGTAAILIATSILLSLSRGGILSLATSMIVFSILLIFKAKQKKAGLFIAVIVAIVIFLTGSSGWETIFQRFENLKDSSGLLWDNRIIIWKDCIGIFKDFPIAGTGAGTLKKIYSRYRTFPGNDILEHAHNDFLEFMCTGGIILPLLMACSLLSVLFAAGKSIIQRREWFSILLFSGCITSLCAISLHSLVDFNIQVGANGLYFFLILALTVSAANTRMRPGLGGTLLNPSRIPTCAMVLAASILLFLAGYLNGGAVFSAHYFSDLREISLTAEMPEKKLKQIHQAAKKAAIFNFLNPHYTHIAAKTSALVSDNADAFRNYAQSIRLDPQNSRYVMDAAVFSHRQGENETAAKLFQQSIDIDKNNMAAYLAYAAMLFEINQAEKGLMILKQAIFVNPEITEICLALMVMYQIDDDRMQRALPNMMAPYLVFGDFLNALGKKQGAENAYMKAMKFVPDDGQIEKKHFLHVVNFFRRNHMDEKALKIMLKAILYFPDDPGLRRIAGDLYRKLGIDYRAEEEYRKAEMLKSVLP